MRSHENPALCSGALTFDDTATPTLPREGRLIFRILTFDVEKKQALVLYTNSK
jgi:hypothetical protein